MACFTGQYNYLHYLSLKGCTYSPTSSYISGISFYFKINSWEDPTQAFVVQKLLKGYSKCHSIKDLRKPVTLQLVKDFSNDLKHVNLSNYEALLFSTAFSVACFGFMRVGELVVHSKDSVTSRVVQHCDVILRGSEMRLYIRFSKRDQNSRSVSLVFTSCQDQQICPVALLYRYIQQRRCIDGPLYCNFNGQPLTRFQFSSVLAKVLKFLVLSRWSVHIVSA